MNDEEDDYVDADEITMGMFLLYVCYGNIRIM